MPRTILRGLGSSSTQTSIGMHKSVSVSMKPDQNVTGLPPALLQARFAGQGVNVTTRWPSCGVSSTSCGSGP